MRNYQWKEDMIQAVSNVPYLGSNEKCHLLRSLEKPISTFNPPFDMFTSIVFEKANEQAEKELRKMI